MKRTTDEDSDGSWLELRYEDVMKATEEGDDRAKTKLAWLKLSGRGGAEKDDEGAVGLLEERVKDDDSDAMWMLGMCHELVMPQQDLQQASDLYVQSAEKGNEIGAFMQYVWHGRDLGLVEVNSSYFVDN